MYQHDNATSSILDLLNDLVSFHPVVYDIDHLVMALGLKVCGIQ